MTCDFPNCNVTHLVFSQTPRKKKTRHSSNPPHEGHIGWVMDSREHRPRSASIRSFTLGTNGYRRNILIVMKGLIALNKNDLILCRITRVVVQNKLLAHSSLLPCVYSSSNASPSEGAPLLSGSYGCTPQSLPKFWHPSHELLRDNGFTQQGYHKYRRRCLNGTTSEIHPEHPPPLKKTSLLLYYRLH